ncbi:MAG: DUF359 domain-containing protein [Fervidicoccaceae archaeon]|jgi:uncharacterized protein (UPF0218 family)|nr:DUF359 domain-containing protein [Fervidicoccaceae archaeon]
MIIPQEDLRVFLSKPFGFLFVGNKFWETGIPEKYNVITVGDYVTKSYIEFLGEAPPLAFIDLKTKRTSIRSEDVSGYFDYIVNIRNPQGTVFLEGMITSLLEATIGFPQDKVLVIVEGEEDLVPLALTYLNLPEDTLIVYGQPNIGVVAYRIEQLTIIKTAGVNTVATGFFFLPGRNH